MSSFPFRAPPFRAEHLGSLLRPSNLLEARKASLDGRGNDQELREIQKAAINDVVRIQLDLGLHAINDGEYGRITFWGSFFEGLEGMTEVDLDLEDNRMYIPMNAAYKELDQVPIKGLACTGKIKHKRSNYSEEFDYLKSLVPETKWKDLKITLPSPSWLHLRYREGKAYPKNVYPTDDDYFADLALAYKQELTTLYDHGLRNVQFDDPNLSAFCSPNTLAGWAKDPYNSSSPDETLEKYIEAYNIFIAELPSDMHIGIHICRGNFISSRDFSEGGYDNIAKLLFEKLNVHTFYLEYDTPRAGSFEPLQHLPTNKSVVLGVVSTKFPALEDEQVLIQRVKDAAHWMAKGTGETEEKALQRCSVSPQCGFASHMDGNPVRHEDMINKLRLVRSVADKIWHEQP